MIHSNKKLLLSFFLGIFSTITLAATGELWDVKMKIDGMGDIGMPSTQVCMAKDKITEKDVKQNDDCRTTNFKSLGARHVKFSFSCKDGSTGDADIQGDAKSFKQTMNMVSKGEKSTMNSEGKNTGKACDPDAGKKEMEAAMAKACDDESKKFSGYLMFFPSQGESQCGKYKAAYCATAKSTASKMNGNATAFKENAFAHGLGPEHTDLAGSWQKAVKACGAGNPDSIAKNAYDDAIKTNNWEAARYINKSEVDAIYARECVGRNYTSRKIKEGYHNLCNGVAESATESGSGSSSSSSNSSSSSGDPTKGTTSPVEGAVKGAKKLKDLFGF